MSNYTFRWEEVWIIGNGPSAARLLPSIPEGASVLAINDAVFNARWSKCDDVVFTDGDFRFVKGRPLVIAVFSLDRNWVKRNRDFLASFHGERHVALPPLYRAECGDVP